MSNDKIFVKERLNNQVYYFQKKEQTYERDMREETHRCPNE